MKKRMITRGISGSAALILTVLLSAACSLAAAPQTRSTEETGIVEGTEEAGIVKDTADAEKAEKAVEAEQPGETAEAQKPGETAEADREGETKRADKERKTKRADKEGETAEAEKTEEPAAEAGTGQTAAGREKPSPEMLCFGLPADFDPASVPAFGREAWADINDDVPFFTEKEMEDARNMAAAVSAGYGQPHGYQMYGPLDRLGRCTGACALVGTETLPREERGNISSVKPTGWHKAEYDHIDGGLLYNRCHLIGFGLTGQNINEQNLITGTRYMNVEGMLPYEDSVLAYVRGTGNHVLYRVSPLFEGDNLLASGVLMEARSIEDPLVQFCAFCYNVQPGIEIDYATGASRLMEAGGEAPAGSVPTGGETENGNASGVDTENSDSRSRGPAAGSASSQEQQDYVVNVRSRIFHHPYCDSVKKMKEKNKQDFSGQRDELIDKGYKPCQNCNP